MRCFVRDHIHITFITVYCQDSPISVVANLLRCLVHKLHVVRGVCVSEEQSVKGSVLLVVSDTMGRVSVVGGGCCRACPGCRQQAPGRMGYLELKLFKNTLTSFVPLKAGNRSPLCQVPSLYQEGDREFRAEKAVHTNLLTSSLVYYPEPTLLPLVSSSQMASLSERYKCCLL